MLKSKNCLFINKSLNIMLCVYLNNITVINLNDNIIKSFIINIKKHFNIKDLGLIKDYLRIEINYNQKGYFFLS
jgi:hypothetical protein